MTGIPIYNYFFNRTPLVFSSPSEGIDEAVVASEKIEWQLVDIVGKEDKDFCSSRSWGTCLFVLHSR